MKDLEDKRTREKETVSLMIGIYCRGRHRSKAGQLCEECRQLNEYAAARVDHCPRMATKTFCSSCKIHCYRPDMRDRIRTVMRYAGPRMIFYHPILGIKHLIEAGKRKRAERSA